MKRKVRFVTVCCLAAMLTAGALSRADAAVITFEGTDLTDIVAGQDLWMYEYVVSGVAFAPNQGFSVYFNPALYDNLQSPPPAVSADWDILAFQPDAGLPSDGIYDALALASNASLGQPFALTFTWLGSPGTTPGSQAFTINQFDLAGNLSFLESGHTLPAGGTPPIPEPSTLLLLGSGIVAAAGRRIASSRR